jgi:3-oxoacid CoA-transferase subunit A
MPQLHADASSAVRTIFDGASLAVGGFGLCGIPMSLIRALDEQGTRDLRIVSNNCGIDGWGLGLLLREHRISRLTCSYMGEHRELERQYLEGELEVELVPQGTLAERLRAGGVGIPAFYTPAGAGTLVASGGLPLRFAADGSIAEASSPKEVREFGGRPHLLETAIRTDFALVRASTADTAGNLVFHLSARNFNPLCAMAGRVTIAEVERVVEAGTLDPDAVHTPGVFVDHLVVVDAPEDKRIERRTVRTAEHAWD